MTTQVWHLRQSHTRIILTSLAFWLLLNLLFTEKARSQSFGGDMKNSVTPLEPHSGGKIATDRSIGSIEPVFQFFDAMPTGVTVAQDGRIFINFPRWGDEVPFTVGVVQDGKVVAYPDQTMNTFDSARPAETLSSVQSVVVDPANRLWILDTAAPKFSTPLVGAAKLVGIDLATNRVVKSIVLPPTTVLPTTYLNDVRFDLREGKGGVAYITDSSANGPGGIIVVDLETGESWRKLSGHKSTTADLSFVPIVEGDRLAMREKGKSPVPM